MTITSKYEAKCKKCNGTIQKGQQIEWSKENGSQHLSCPVALSPCHRVTVSGSPVPLSGSPGPYQDKFRRLEQVYNTAEQQERETAHTSYLAAVARLKTDQSASLWLREAARVLDFSVPAGAISDVKKLLQLQQLRIPAAHVTPRKEQPGDTRPCLQQGRAS